MTVTVVEWITLDGVMQSPARPDEDTRGGFSRGGWSAEYGDQVMGEVMADRMSKGAAEGGALLLGRRTYMDFAEVWPRRTDNPFTERLNNSMKYVASTTLREPLPWENSILVTDANSEVAELKRERDLAILGSGGLVRSLMRADLIDEFLLSIHPVVLGQGQRLFEDSGPYARFELVESRPTTTGVIIANYIRRKT